MIMHLHFTVDSSLECEGEMSLSALAAHAHESVATHSLRAHCIIFRRLYSLESACSAVWIAPLSAAAFNDENKLYSILRVCMRFTVNQNKK